MAKTKAAAKPELLTDVTIPRSVLKHLVEAVESLQQADAAYKSCQASVFRQYAEGVFRAGNTVSAIEQAKEALGDE